MHSAVQNCISNAERSKICMVWHIGADIHYVGAIFTGMLLGIIRKYSCVSWGKKVKYIHDVLLARELLSGRRRLIRLRVDHN